MFLLDSSAWLAHLFGEAGAEQVNLLFDDPDNEVSISALSIPEVYGRLKALGIAARWPEVRDSYAALFAKTLPADEVVANRAVALREAASARLPTIDTLIAATAAVNDLTLVHRDPHFAALSSTVLRQQMLPEK
ncbi:MAG: PIN domain-containing protein [Candidatus Promineifilaceae bacterium]|nr:PIN domain-containing protein [Anaerolineaceae bacterium]